MFLFSLIEAISSKKRRRFKYVREKICHECSSSKYVSIDGVELLHFKMATMTSSHAEKCCHLLCVLPASEPFMCSSVRQFLI